MSLLRPFRQLLYRLLRPLLGPWRRRLDQLERNSEAGLLLLAQVRLEQLRTTATTLREAEFKVFSQWGEDGMIQYLIARVPLASATFVEFGVDDYRESNTRFLLMNNRWAGLIIDGNADQIRTVRQSPLYWQYDVTALDRFITRENINELLATRFTGDLGLLSIDVDGNDYWIWEAITVVQPRIVICEYNSVLGGEHAVTVPYRADFCRREAHASGLYFGASLRALVKLAQAKGYVFVGCTQAGNDAFFVRRDVAGGVVAVDPAAGYVASQFRESRNAQGELTFLRGADRLRAIDHLDVYDLELGKLRPLRDVISSTH